MSGAVANVALKVGIEGVETVSGAADRAKKALGGLAGDTRKAADAAKDLAAAGGGGGGIDANKIQQSTGKAAGAFAALTGAMGPAGAALGEIGRDAQAFAATAGVIPGPVGLAVAAIAGLTAGTYLLGKNLSESAAKMELLGSANAAGLRDKLNLSVDAAIKLSQAISDLKDKSLTPSDRLMQQIATNAQRMGKDGGDAATAFVKALEGGPEALKAFQAEYGKLNGLQADTSGLVTRLGLSAQLLGITKEKTAAELASAAVDAETARIKKANVEIATLEADLARQRNAELNATQAYQRLNGKIEADNLDKQIAAQQQIVKLSRQALADAQAQVTKDAEKAAAVDALKARVDNLTAKAGAERSKERQHTELLEANTAKRLDAQRQLNAFNAQYNGQLSGALRTAQLLLETAVFQAKAERKALDDGAKAERQAKAKAAMDASNARASAERSVELRKLNALVAADGVTDAEERLAIAHQERANAIADAQATIKNKKLLAETLKVIDDEYQGKKAAIAREDAAALKKVDDDALKEHEAYLARVAGREAAAEDAKAITAKVSNASMATMLRAAGKEREAIAAEEAQAVADLAQVKIQAEREVVAASRGLVAESDEVAAIKIAAVEKVKQAEVAYLDGKRKRSQDESELSRQARAEAADTLQSAADAFKALGQIGNSGAGAFGESISSAIKGFKDLDKAMASSSEKSRHVAEAVGGAVGDISATWIDAEKERTIKQLDNEEKRALSTATTEDQRAAITAKFEQQKADAVNSAERQKAAVRGLMELAEAAASYPNIPAMVAHGAAAVMFGAVAGGIVGGTSAAPAGGDMGGGGFNSAATSSGSGSSTGGGGQTVVINFNQPLATKQEVGKAVHGALRSLNGTGIAMRKGA